jgi:hypothetical protein
LRTNTFFDRSCDCPFVPTFCTGSCLTASAAPPVPLCTCCCCLLLHPPCLRAAPTVPPRFCTCLLLLTDPQTVWHPTTLSLDLYTTC